MGLKGKKVLTAMVQEEMEDVPLTPRPKTTFDAILVYGNGEHEQITWEEEEPLGQMERALKEILFPCGIPKGGERAVESQSEVYISKHSSCNGYAVYFLQYRLRNDSINMLFKNLGESPSSTLLSNVIIMGPSFVVKERSHPTPSTAGKWQKMDVDDLWDVGHIMGFRDIVLEEEEQREESVSRKRRCNIL